MNNKHNLFELVSSWSEHQRLPWERLHSGRETWISIMERTSAGAYQWKEHFAPVYKWRFLPDFWLNDGFSPRRHQLLPCARFSHRQRLNFSQKYHLQGSMPSVCTAMSVHLPSYLSCLVSSSLTYHIQSYNIYSHTSYIHTLILSHIHTHHIHRWRWEKPQEGGVELCFWKLLLLRSR